MWAAVLIPEWWRERGKGGGRRRSSIDAFQQQLSVLGRTTPTSVEPAHRLGDVRPPIGSLSTDGVLRVASSVPAARGVPRSPGEASQRRRAVLAGLVGLALVTFMGWTITGSTLLLAVHVVVDVLVIGFAWLLLRHRQLRTERLTKLAYLPHHERPALEPVLARSAR
jgi:Flp pilus assembly protein TadB